MQHPAAHACCLLGLFLPTLTDSWAGAAECCLQAARLLLALGLALWVWHRVAVGAVPGAALENCDCQLPAVAQQCHLVGPGNLQHEGQRGDVSRRSCVCDMSTVRLLPSGIAGFSPTILLRMCCRGDALPALLLPVLIQGKGVPLSVPKQDVVS